MNKVYLLYNDAFDKNLMGVYTTFEKAKEAVQEDFKYYKEQSMFDIVGGVMNYKRTDVWVEEVKTDTYFEDEPDKIYLTNKGKKVCQLKG